MKLELSAKGEARLLDLICLLIGTIMLYRGITDFFLFKDNPWRTLLGLIFFGGVVSIYLMYRRRRIGFWLFAFFDFSVGVVFIFFLQDIWYHHVLPHVAYAAVFVPFYKNMRWGPAPDPSDRRVPPEPRRSWIGRLTAPLIGLVERWPAIARLIERIPPLQRLINRLIINGVTSSTPHRPHPLSLWTPGTTPVPRVVPPPTQGTFVSWPGLVDRAFTGRHLPPISEAAVAGLPSIEKVGALFERETMEESGKTTALFCFFAQWFTDSFLRTNPDDARKNTSNHEIDLCQIYGLGQGATRRLRELRGGRLKARKGQPLTPGGVRPTYPELLADPTTLEVKSEFAGISFDPILATSFEHKDPPHGFARDLRQMLKDGIGEWTQTDDRWRMHYAAGLERANSTIAYSAISTIFLREHNRLADQLAAHYPEMASQADGDDRLFETARNINIVLLLKIIVEDYINHLAASPFRLRLEQGFADRCRWYRANRISLEFNLLYRWHAMVPGSFELRGRTLADQEFRFNNALLEEFGVEAVLDAAASQPAGRMKLHNTPDFLIPAEHRTIALGRQFRLAGFNAYRRRWQLPSYNSIAELAKGDDALITELTQLYPDLDGVPGIERVELSVGLLAEQRKRKEVLSSLLLRMVASDAFSQALTNPLLASYVYGADCFTAFGVEVIEGTGSFAELVERNRTPGSQQVDATFSNRFFHDSTPA